MFFSILPMLYLVIDPSGKPVHKWSVEPEKDFVGYKVVGPAIKNEKGEPEDSAHLKVVGGRVVVDEAAKADKKRAEEEEKARKATEKASCEETFAKIDSGSTVTVAELSKAMRCLRRKLL